MTGLHLLRHPEMRLVAGNLVRRALVALGSTVQREPAAMRCSALSPEPNARGEFLVGGTHRQDDTKKVLTRLAGFGILGEFA